MSDADTAGRGERSEVTDRPALEARCGEGHGISAGAGSRVSSQGLPAAALSEHKPPGPQGSSFPAPLPGSVARRRAGCACGPTPLFCLCPVLPRGLGCSPESRTAARHSFRSGRGRPAGGCHSVWACEPASALRDGSRAPARGWPPGTRSCSWIWSVRRWISRRCISRILPVSSCTFNLMVGGTPGKSSLDTAGDRAALGLGHLFPDCCKGS